MLSSKEKIYSFLDYEIILSYLTITQQIQLSKKELDGEYLRVSRNGSFC